MKPTEKGEVVVVGEIDKGCAAEIERPVGENNAGDVAPAETLEVGRAVRSVVGGNRGWREKEQKRRKKKKK